MPIFLEREGKVVKYFNIKTIWNSKFKKIESKENTGFRQKIQ